jgi:hypothetical protein
MELTADMFKEMVGPLAGDAACAGDRRGPRTPTQASVTLLPFSDAFSLHAIRVPVRNVSRGGFRFLYDRPVALGESFAVVLPETSAPPMVILCTVAHWEPLAADLYAIGARFAQVLRQPRTPIELDLETAPPEARKAS